MGTLVSPGIALFLHLLCMTSPGLTDAAIPKTLTNFTLYTHFLDWHKAAALCYVEGKHLIRVEDAEKHDFLKEVFKEWNQEGHHSFIDKNVWMDAYAPIPGAAEFRWSNCSHLPFTSWDPNYPENVTDNRCILLDTHSNDLLFRNDQCNKNMNAVCEEDLKLPCRFIHHPSSTSPSLLSSLNILTFCESSCLVDELCWAYTSSTVSLGSTCKYAKMDANESWVPYLTGLPDISSLSIHSPVMIKRCYGYVFSGSSQVPKDSFHFPDCSVSSSVKSSPTMSILTTEQSTVLPSPSEVSSVAGSFLTASAATSEEFFVLPSPTGEIYVPIPSANDVFTPSLSNVVFSEELVVTHIWSQETFIATSTENSVLIPTQTSSPTFAVDLSLGLQVGMTFSNVPTSPVLTPSLPGDLIDGLVHVAATVIDGALNNIVSDPLLLTTLLPPVLPVPTISDLVQVVASVGFPLDIIKTPPQIRPSNLCNCFCKFNAVSNPKKKADQEAASLAKELTVNHTNVSTTRRRLTSAPDDRKSALVIGIVSVGVLTATCLIVAIPDVIRFIKWIRFLRKGKGRLLASKKYDEDDGNKACDECNGVDPEHSLGNLVSDPDLTERESEV